MVHPLVGFIGSQVVEPPDEEDATTLGAVVALAVVLPFPELASAPLEAGVPLVVGPLVVGPLVDGPCPV